MRLRPVTAGRECGKARSRRTNRGCSGSQTPARTPRVSCLGHDDQRAELAASAGLALRNVPLQGSGLWRCKETHMACAKWFITRGIAAVSLFGAVCFAAPCWTIQSWSAEPPTIRLGYEADAIDIASSGAVGVLFAAAEGVTGKVIASLVRESPRGFATSYYVKVDSPMQTVGDAKGKIVGINGFATDGQLWLETALARHNLSDADVTITPVPFPAMSEALRSGKVEIGEFPQPFADMVEKDFPVPKLFDSQYGMPFEQELIILLGKEAFLGANATAVRGLLDDLRASLAFYLEKPREARQILMDAKMVRLAPDIYLNMKDVYRDPSPRPVAAALERARG